MKVLVGSDPEAFTLGQFDLYVKHFGILVAFPVFKDNHLHLESASKISSNPTRSYTHIDDYNRRSIADEVIAD